MDINCTIKFEYWLYIVGYFYFFVQINFKLFLSMYSDRYHFIAVLESSETGSIGVYFPDLPGCVSGAETNGKSYKKRGGSVVASLIWHGTRRRYYVEVYMKPYRERINSRYIKKTLSIPNWLNTLLKKKE